MAALKSLSSHRLVTAPPSDDSLEFSLLSYFDFCCKRHRGIALSSLFLRYGSLKDPKLLQKAFQDGNLFLECLSAATRSQDIRSTVRRSLWLTNATRPSHRLKNMREVFRVINHAYPEMPSVEERFAAERLANGNDRKRGAIALTSKFRMK